MERLTPSQREALDTHQPVFVEAGAGSGKTTLLVQRYLNIFKEHPGTPISQVVAFTYTQKAAAEMLSRIQDLIPEKDLPYARISTIHSFCSQLLRRYPLQAGLDPDFMVLENNQYEVLIQEAIDQGLDKLQRLRNADMAAILHEDSLSRLRSDLNSLFEKRDMIASAEDSPILRLFRHCLTGYHHLKASRRSVDYSDLIEKTRLLFEQHPKILTDIRSQIRFVMVDEFQDTDPIQWRLIQDIVSDSANLFVVGDLRQAIYAFRGADPTLFTRVKDEFSGKIVSLEDNFRSQKTILDFVNPFFSALFEADQHLEARRSDDSGSVSFALLDGIDEEIDSIAHWILNHPVQFKDVAILFRTKSRMTRFQDGLRQRGVPAEIYSPLESKPSEEIVDLVNLARGLLFPNDTLSWIRVLKSPLFNISEQEIYERNHEHANQTISGWLNLAAVAPLHDVVTRAIRECGQWETYRDSANLFLETLENLQRESVTQNVEILAALDLLLPHFNDSSEALLSNDSNAVKLLTIHSAKGLEFPAVIVAECGRTFLFSHPEPDIVSREKEAIIEEEKRLFYVACTRAKDHLFIVGSPKKTAGCYLDFVMHFSETIPGEGVIEFRFSQGVKRYSLHRHVAVPPSLASPSRAASLRSVPLLSQLTSKEGTVMTMTTSELIAYLECPKKYHWRELIRKMRPPISGSFGTSVHRAIETILSDSNSSMLPTVESHVSNFKKTKIYNLIKNGSPYHSEKSFAVKFGSLVIEGRFDSLVYDTNHWIVVDYKTDAHSEGEILPRYRLQMKIYALAVKTIIKPQDRYAARLIYTKSGRETELVFEPAELETFSEHLAKIPQEIASYFFEAPSLSVCTTCPIYSIYPQCPAHAIQINPKTLILPA